MGVLLPVSGIKNRGELVGADKLGGEEQIAIAVKKANKEMHDWINKELKNLGKETYLHKLCDTH
ncbi:hypothetical protein U2I54_16675 [Bacillus pseudomycoides]|uniref:Uncharacterized protein n=1 Tax=Bacillus bingmayongensis TaxID=1150157 RepID=A0ABU5JYX4_9BACI|nr:hypothetical protein [Bacillus pseudomycoides]